MFDLTKSFILAASLVLAAPAVAQETPAANADAPALSMGQETATVGSAYLAATHGDWQVRCMRTEDGSDPCQLYQLLDDAEGNNVAEFSLFDMPQGQQAAAGATIITPLETLLTQHITLQVDDQPAKIYPFTLCGQVGCIARVGFTAEEVEAFKKGTKATLTIVPAVAPDQKVTLDLSLKGFTAGLAAVTLAEE